MRALLLLLILSLAAPALAASPDPGDPGADGAPVKKERKKRGENITTERSVEVPAPDPLQGFSESDLRRLTEISAQTQIKDAELKLKTIENKIAELDKQGEELTAPPPPPPDPKEQALARVFPMPGGNPQVVSVIGGNRKAMEAKLVFPTGLIYEVTRGTMLENGYIVSDVSSRGVVIEKNGLRITMPISGGKPKGKAPWTDDMGEQGEPVNPVAPSNGGQ